METKIPDKVYFKNRIEYDVVCLRATPTEAEEAYGGVGLVTWEILEGWEIDSMQFHGPKLVSCEIISGIQWTSLIGFYLTPTTLDHLPNLEEELNHFPGR